MFQISSSIAFGEEPTTVDSFLTRGVESAMKGNLDAAIQDFAEAIRLDPKLVDAYKSRGKSYWLKGEFDKAIKDYTEAIRLDPKNAGTYGSRSSQCLCGSIGTHWIRGIGFNWWN